MIEEQKIRTPFSQVKKKLISNKLAVFGMVIIVISFIIAILGYVIMPDKTPNANDSAARIRKIPPVFSAKILKIRKDIDIEKAGFFSRIYFGQESEYLITAISKEPRVERDSVFFIPYPGVEKTEKEEKVKELSEHLLKVVKSVYVLPSEKLGRKTPGNFVFEDGNYTYLDINENIQRVSQEDLEKEFWENCVEDRHYWLGTDKSGRDMLSRLLFGTKISLAIGFMSVLISLIVGVTFGSIAGFFGGIIDVVINWIMTVIWSIPSIMLVIVVSLVLGKGIWVVFFAVGFTMWVDIARVVRGEIMSIKEKQYVEAAHAFGFSSQRIIFKHILPNIIGPLIVISSQNFATAILVEAGLSFLGFGVEAPMPSWGIMVSEGYSALATRGSWHLILFPSICISMMVLAFNLFGNGLRDAYDPKSLK